MNKRRRPSACYSTIALVSLLTAVFLIPSNVAHAEERQDLHEMEVLGVAPAQGGDQTAVLLRSKGAKREITLFVGPLEAQGIAVPLQQRKPPRPLTHDLALSLLAALRSHLGREIGR